MKFVIVATLFLAMLAGCFAASLTGSGSQLSPSGIIQQLIGELFLSLSVSLHFQVKKIEINYVYYFLFRLLPSLIGQYEQRYQGPSVIHPEEVAHVIDVNNLHI